MNDCAGYKELLKPWGKSSPHVPLIEHMMDVGCLGKTIYQSPLNKHIRDLFSRAIEKDDSHLPQWLAFFSAMHDIGKCHPLFQMKADTSEVLHWREQGFITYDNCFSRRYRHEAFSAEWLTDYLMDSLGWTKKAARTIAAAIRGHHGNFTAEFTLNEDPHEEGYWQTLRLEITRLMMQVFELTGAKPIQIQNHSVFGLLLSGLLVLSDWIASNDENYHRPTPSPCPINYFKSAEGAAKKALTDLGFLEELTWPEKPDFISLYGSVFASLRPTQKACERLAANSLKAGLYLIEAPMGEGKTEAALFLASRLIAKQGRQGFYFALPTAATSNQMYGRVQHFLNIRKVGMAEKVRLVHGMAWLVDEISPVSIDEKADEKMWGDWFLPKKRALLSPYGVGTVDQAMMSVLNVKHSFLRLFGLAGKVLVIDEIHAYDAYMTNILTLLLKWCSELQIPVFLLSATLPVERRKELFSAYGINSADENISNSYPLITYGTPNDKIHYLAVPESEVQTKITLCCKPYLNDSATIADLARELAHKEGCVCVIANTVLSAQEIYTLLKTRYSSEIEQGLLDVLLFHARFPAERRQEIEENVLSLFDKRSLLPPNDTNYRKRPQRTILVATQVVEQSLDIDFDEMISELAPIDLLLQRAGRLHRHKRLSRASEPCLYIMIPPEVSDLSSSGNVYEPFILMKTQLLLLKTPEIRIPADMRRLVETVYDGDIDDSLEQSLISLLRSAFQSMREKQEVDSSQALRFLLSTPQKEIFSLVTVSSSFDEGDEGATSYFVAKTRLGNDTQRIILLEEELTGLLQEKSRSAIKKLHSKTVSVPRFWLINLQPLDSEPFEWQSGILILPAKEGKWSGTKKDGTVVTIRDDRELGLVREERRNI